MKKTTALFLCFFTTVFVTRAQNSPTKDSASYEIKTPFSEKEYKTNKDFYRATSMGKSSNITIAKKIALNNAKAEIASLIKSSFKKTTDIFEKEVQVNNKAELEVRFEELQKEVVEQELSNINIVDEKSLRVQNLFEYWVCIEMPKKPIIDNFLKLSPANVSYDKVKYNEIFNQQSQNFDTGE
ncbi:MAG: hypothetical protein ACOYNH_12135 [Bacteroidia bacterium]